MDATTTTSTELVRSALAGIASNLPSTVHACVFNLVWDDEVSTEVAIVVMILEYEDWNEAAEEACATASDIAWDALNPLGVIADVICRTQSEHEAAREAESWFPVDDTCS